MRANPLQPGESRAAYDLRIERALAINAKTWTVEHEKAYLVRLRDIEAKEAEAARLAAERAQAEELEAIRRELRRQRR